MKRRVAGTMMRMMVSEWGPFPFQAAGHSKVYSYQHGKGSCALLRGQFGIACAWGFVVNSTNTSLSEGQATPSSGAHGERPLLGPCPFKIGSIHGS